MTTTHSVETFNGIVTSWIPLTTPGPVFSQACTSAMYFGEDSSGTYFAAYDPSYGSSIDQSLQCLAKEQTEWWLQPDMPSTTYQLGPFACPSMYTTATTEAIDPTTTLIACCPSGYAFQNTIINKPSANQCLSYLSPGQIISQESQIDASHYTTTVITVGPSGLTVHGAHVNGYMFATTTNNNSSAPTATEASSTFVWEPSNVPQSTSTTAFSNPNSLTTGAKVGIGLGVALVVIGLCSFLGTVILVKRRDAKALRRLEAGTGSQYYSYPSPRNSSVTPIAGLQTYKG